jgi:hypothetical protein
MRIGIRPTGNRNAGGIPQYGITMLDALDRQGSDDFIVLTVTESLDLMSLDRRNLSHGRSALIARPD